MQFGYARALFALVMMLATATASAAAIQHIPLLDNRFRVDHAVESITLLVQRKDGTRPVVIVRPDGSKWYAHRHPDSVKWSYADNSDMVRIESPTPGPWQLVGSVESGSEVRILTGVELRHDAFPQQIYRGQRLKINAEIAGDGERIAIRDFYRQLRWRVVIASENRSGDENFGSGPFQIGGYDDDGEGLDERPDDGVFAAELGFNYPAGLYNIQVRVSNPVFSRVSEQKIEVLPQPLRLSVISKAGKIPVLNVETVNEVLLNELHLSLEVVTPKQHRIPLAVDPNRLSYQLPLEMLSGYGAYFITGDAVGTTVDGREFYLTLPKINFHWSAPPPPGPTAEELRLQALEQARIEEQQAKERVMSVLLYTSLFTLLTAAIGIGAWWWRNRQRKVPADKSTPAPELTPDEVDFNAFSQVPDEDRK